MKLDRPKRQLDLYGFVVLSHHPQKRKYTGEPYHNHLIAVAEMAEEYGLEYGFEIGLCHDLLEDTDVTANRLDNRLQYFGYDEKESFFIVSSVIELTDVFTHEEYPNLNRLNRKSMECLRMAGINSNTQSVKYCDLIDNTKSIVKHDEGFAKIYLREKFNLLQVMNKGSNDLYNLVMKNISE